MWALQLLHRAEKILLAQNKYFGISNVVIFGHFSLRVQYSFQTIFVLWTLKIIHAKQKRYIQQIAYNLHNTP
jgi:hypothetical protein